jgi:alpha-aminoadipic semialdehyde synthase
MAVDILPAEIPMDASVYFSSKLSQLIPLLLDADFGKPFDKLELDSRIKDAAITHQGELTPRYRYLRQYLDNLR